MMAIKVDFERWEKTEEENSLPFSTKKKIWIGKGPKHFLNGFDTNENDIFLGSTRSNFFS